MKRLTALLQAKGDLALVEAERDGLRAERDGLRAERDQLQHALESRVTIEQAKGVVAERNRIAPDEAFDMLREHARRGNLVLRDLCAAVVGGLTDVVSPVSAPRKAVPPRNHPAAVHKAACDAPPMPGPGRPPPGLNGAVNSPGGSGGPRGPG